ncbi:MAG: PEP-CTERM sorting domain-containing protein [Thiobacillus sp.]
MKFAMTKIAAAAVLAMASSAAMAVPVAAVSMDAQTGAFDLGGSPGTPGSWSFSGAGQNLIDDINVAYGSSFTFFGNPVNVFSGDGTYAPYGGTAVQGGNPISAMLDADTGTITVDLSSWTAYWNGTNFNQGSATATGTWDSATGAFDVAWSSTVVGGPFNGQTGNWSLQGVAAVAAVPEASTYGMMLAGLGLVGVAVRRRKLV